MKINLTFDAVLRLDNMVLPCDPVAEFTSDVYNLTDLVVCARNGATEWKWRVTDGKVDLTPVLFAGEVELSVALVRRGETLKKWRSVPFIVREEGGEYLACDELRDLARRVAELEEKTKIIM